MKIRLTHRAAVVMAISLCLTTSLIFAQEQPGLTDLDKRFLRKEDPQFLFQVPKKLKKKDEFAEFLRKWKQVDLDARQELEIKQKQALIDQERAKDAPNEERILDLEGEIKQIKNRYDARVFQLELEGKAEHWVLVVYDVVTKDNRVNNQSPRNFAHKPRNQGGWGFKIDKTLVEKDTTSKALKRRQGESEQWEVLAATDDGKRVWRRVETLLLPRKDGKKNLIRVVQQMPESDFNKDTRRDMELLYTFMRF